MAIASRCSMSGAGSSSEPTKEVHIGQGRARSGPRFGGSLVLHAVARRAPHPICAYSTAVAADFHAFYRDCPGVRAEGDRRDDDAPYGPGPPPEGGGSVGRRERGRRPGRCGTPAG